MKKYAKIINNETKACIVGQNDSNTTFYQKLGMTLQEVEEGYDHNWYVSGYAPQKPISLIRQERIRELKDNLRRTDYIALKLAEDSSLSEKYAHELSLRKEWRKEINDLEEALKEEEA